jgi:multiple sugar transport system substrate-binding protein
MKPRFKRLLCAIFLLVGLGCTQQSTPESNKKTITIWWAQWDPAVGLQELGNRFEQETGIAVKVHQIPWQSYQDQVFLNFGNNKTDFDIVIGDSQWIGRGATRDLYLDLTDWLPSATDMSKIHPRAAKYLCEYPADSGKYYAAPCETDAVGFVYRKDWFENDQEKTSFKKKYGRELSVPNTWTEFRDIAEFFYRPDDKLYGCALLTGRGYDSLTMGFQMFMWGFGGSWGDPKTFQTDGHVNKPEVAASLALFKSLIASGPNGASNFDYGKTYEAFVNGSTAMSMNYFAFYPGIVKQMGDKAGFFMVPQTSATEIVNLGGKQVEITTSNRRVVSLGGQGFSISTKVSTEQQDLAKKFIGWFLQTKNQQEWITKDAGFTANTDILQTTAFQQATPYNKPFAESLDFVQDFWNVPVYNELLAVSQRYLGEAIDGVRPTQEALNLLAKEHDQIFKDAGLKQ